MRADFFGTRKAIFQACTAFASCYKLLLHFCIYFLFINPHNFGKGKLVQPNIGCPIQSALCHIEAKSFVNYKLVQPNERDGY